MKFQLNKLRVKEGGYTHDDPNIELSDDGIFLRYKHFDIDTETLKDIEPIVCSGLLDKNSNIIYEGDILIVKYKFGLHLEYTTEGLYRCEISMATGLSLNFLDMCGHTQDNQYPIRLTLSFENGCLGVRDGNRLVITSAEPDDWLNGRRDFSDDIVIRK